jgi:hypothetical protein
MEGQLRAGHLEVHGLCLALVGWSTELRIIDAERKKPPELNPAAKGTELKLGQALIEYRR